MARAGPALVGKPPDPTGMAVRACETTSVRARHTAVTDVACTTRVCPWLARNARPILLRNTHANLAGMTQCDEPNENNTPQTRHKTETSSRTRGLIRSKTSRYKKTGRAVSRIDRV